MTASEEIKVKLQSASLSEFEVALWENVVGNLPENMRKDILDVFNASVDGVRILTDNLVAKTQALKSGDIKQWGKVLEGDKSIIENTSGYVI